MTNNIQIITDYGELVYKSEEDLGIIFNRIADDLNEIENRYGDFSYDFVLPVVKQNEKVFDYVVQKGATNKFAKNQNLKCRIYNNNSLILNGLLSLQSISEKDYICRFFSNFTEFIDKLEEKKCNELEFPLIKNWNYEESIISHINSNYKNSDETFYQYPINFYSTFYAEHALYNGKSDRFGVPFRQDNEKQCFYYMLNSLTTSRYNRFFYHQIPPAVYLVSIIKQIIKEAGFKLGGQFFDDENIKKIICLYAGENDIYDKATGIAAGSDELDLQVGRFLPDMRITDFIQTIINMFNLYFIIEGDTIIFETYNNIFGDKYNPYNLTNKIDNKTIQFNYMQDNDPSIRFDTANNRQAFGDGTVMKTLSDSAYTTQFDKVNNKQFENVFNKIGEGGLINLRLSEPTSCKKFIYNDYNKSGSNQTATDHTIYLPLLSRQTVVDNDSKNFNRNEDDNYLFNNEATMRFGGVPCLQYYYGIPTTDFENKSGKGSLANYMYVNIYTNAGSTINRVPIPVVSPFQLSNYRDEINAVLDNVDHNNINDRKTYVASYLQSLWHMMGKDGGVDASLITDFSLVFDDGGELHRTLWSEFHRRKYDRYKNSEVLTADVSLNAYDWGELQINRPIHYDGQIYHLVSLENYDIVNQTAIIKMIKHI